MAREEMRRKFKHHLRGRESGWRTAWLRVIVSAAAAEPDREGAQGVAGALRITAPPDTPEL